MPAFSCKSDGRCGPVLSIYACLQRALSNLIGNATRHAPQRSTIVVKIDQADAEVASTVVNQGNTHSGRASAVSVPPFYRVEAVRTEGSPKSRVGLGDRGCHRPYAQEGEKSRDGAVHRPWCLIDSCFDRTRSEPVEHDQQAFAPMSENGELHRRNGQEKWP